MLSQFRTLFSAATSADGDHANTTKSGTELNSTETLKKSEEMNPTNAKEIENVNKTETKASQSDALNSLVRLSQFNVSFLLVI